MSTYYDILRVPEDADDREIKAAYRQAALAYHPDHIPKGVSKRMKDDAAQAWLEIQEAFSVLGNPGKREEYDTLLAEMRQSEEAEKQFEPVAPQSSPPTPRPTPPPTPQQNAPQPSPQTKPTPPAKARSAWLSFCFQAGRRWRVVCLVIASVLFVASGLQNPDTWGIMLGATASINALVACFILIKAGPSPEKTRRYLLNAFCLTTLAVVGITAGSISPAPPKTSLTASEKASAATTIPAINSSTTPFADALKKYGFEVMPSVCQEAPLSELDSCLASVKSSHEKDHLKPKEETAKNIQKTPAAIQDAPISTTLTGTFRGTVHNVNANLEARFVLFIEEYRGIIRGCFGVKPPLYGSGPLEGRIEGDDLQFDVASPLYSLHFVGHRNSVKGWSGTYTALPLGGKQQYGYYDLEKQDSKRYFKNFDPGTSCPTDKDMNH